jgi:signal transduction histidine kinase
LTQLWYSVIELPVRMPGVDRPTKLAVARDITERKVAEEKIRALSHRLFSVQEDERKHLSRELHDDLGQRLNAAKIAVDLLARDLAGSPGDIASRLSQLSQVLKGSVESVRHLSAGLRPASLERLGLVGAIRNDCDQLAARQGFKVEFTHHGMDGVRLSHEAEINLYRVVQEALNNVVKHARATEVGIQLVASHPIVRMRIRDNGTGFDPAQRKAKKSQGLGLVGMAERMDLLHGSFKIHSNPGMGTRITTEIPIGEAIEPQPQEEAADGARASRCAAVASNE